jgi:hypothetical protein
MILRRERPHPGAQLSFTDHDGYRFQAILTDQPDPDIAVLECRHRQRAHAEDHIRNDKDAGLRNLPFKDFFMNEVWLELVLIAHNLIRWTQILLLTGELAKAEPKRLRYRLLHLAAKLSFHGRRARLRLQAHLALEARATRSLHPPQSAPSHRRLTPSRPSSTTTAPRRQTPRKACSQNGPSSAPRHRNTPPRKD